MQQNLFGWSFRVVQVRIRIARERIAKRLLALEENLRPFDIKKLHGQEGYRLRVDDYRVLFTIDDSTKTVMTYAIGHRRQIYR